MLARKVGRFTTGVACVIYIIVALVMIAVGAFIKVNDLKYDGETTGTVIRIETSGYGEDEDHRVFVAYTIDDIEYINEYNMYSSDYFLGKEVTVLYNTSNPHDISSSSGIFPYIFFGVGAVLIIAAISTAVSQKKHGQGLYDMTSIDGFNQDNAFSSVTGSSTENTSNLSSTFYFSSLGTGNKLTDTYKQEIYSAKMTKFHLFTPFEYDFYNSRTGATYSHLIGHTVTISGGTRSISTSTSSYFSFDGVRIWDYLKSRGIEFVMEFRGLTLPGFSIKRNGTVIAKVEPRGTGLYDDPEVYKGVRAIPTKGYYKIQANEDDLDDIFLVLFTFTRVEYMM